MAHKKGMGSSRNGRESESKRLGVKKFGGQKVVAGNILVRQRGTKHHPGDNVGIGKDHTLYALIDGTVVFKKKSKNRSFVSIEPIIDTLVEEKLDAKNVVEDSPKVEEPVKEEPKAEESSEEIKEEPVKEEPKAEESSEEVKEKPKAKKKSESKPKAKKAAEEKVEKEEKPKK